MISIVPHEYGHVICAKYFGVRCNKIIMTALGGMALLQDDFTDKWYKEFLITLAGPAVSLYLAVVFGCFSLMTYKITNFFVLVAIINAVLFLFNCLPVFPLDGGRILRSLLHYFFSLKTATMITIRFGQIAGTCLAILFLIFGFYTMAVIMVFMAVISQFELDRMKVIGV